MAFPNLSEIISIKNVTPNTFYIMLKTVLMPDNA